MKKTKIKKSKNNITTTKIAIFRRKEIRKTYITYFVHGTTTDNEKNLAIGFRCFAEK